MVFAGRLHQCQRAIAFSGQSAVDPSIVPWEGRYDQWFKGVSKWNGLDATKMLDPHVRYLSFFGRQEAIDLRHAERLISVRWPSMTVCIIDRCGHDVSLYLKQQGLLIPLIESLISEGRECKDWAPVLRPVAHEIFGDPPADC